MIVVLAESANTALTPSGRIVAGIVVVLVGAAVYVNLGRILGESARRLWFLRMQQIGAIVFVVAGLAIFISGFLG